MIILNSCILIKYFLDYGQMFFLHRMMKPRDHASYRCHNLGHWLSLTCVPCYIKCSIQLSSSQSVYSWPTWCPPNNTNSTRSSSTSLLYVSVYKVEDWAWKKILSWLLICHYFQLRYFFIESLNTHFIEGWVSNDGYC